MGYFQQENSLSKGVGSSGMLGARYTNLARVKKGAAGGVGPSGREGRHASGAARLVRLARCQRVCPSECPLSEGLWGLWLQSPLPVFCAFV